MGPHLYIYSDYVRPIAELGGAPVIIPVLRDSDYYVDSLSHADGLVLIGGVDVNPYLFGQTVERGFGHVDPDKDFGEIEMTRIALKMNIPILAICRGIQLLNMVMGGTIHQHIPDDIPNAYKHNPGFPPGTLSHDVSVVKGSLLHKITGSEKIAVDSSHHQAVDKVGNDLFISARSGDGVIETLEMPSKRWVLAVQWHPERIWRSTKEHRQIFEAFIDACRVK